MASTRSPKSTETLSRARSLSTEQTYHRLLRESCRTYQMRARRGSFLRRVHLSSSSQPATKLPLMKRILPQVVCLRTQSKHCPLTTIKPSLSAATWKHWSRTYAHRQNCRSRWSVCMLKSTNITFSWCRQVRAQGMETLPYRQLNSKVIPKRWLDPISARRRTIIFLAQTLQRLTRSARHLSAKKKWPAPWLRRNLVQTPKCKVWGAWTRTLRWRSNSRNSTQSKIPPANVPSLFRKSESRRRSLKRQRMPI